MTAAVDVALLRATECYATRSARRSRLGEVPVDIASNNQAVDGSIAPVRSAEAARRGRSVSLAMAGLALEAAVQRRTVAGWQARFAPAVATALNAGRTPQTLTALTGANTSGVRNLDAVLAAQLSPVELLPPQTRRPLWCGWCDEVTRMLGFDDDTPRPCSRCKSAADSHASPLRRLAGARAGPPGPLRVPWSPSVRVVSLARRPNPR